MGIQARYRMMDQVMGAPAYSAGSGPPPRYRGFSKPSPEKMAAAPASVDRVLASSGIPLDRELRRDMEQFRRRLSRVRVHSGPAADQSARDINAHAYMLGTTSSLAQASLRQRPANQDYYFIREVVDFEEGTVTKAEIEPQV